jgi:diphthamide biosynthesis protein 4
MARPDYYDVLRITKNASLADVKRAYQAALLAAHPDKRTGRCTNEGLTIDLVREAFAILSSSVKRAEYDRQLVTRESRGPRPAQVLSLEDFVEASERWTYACRCGGVFAITEADMDADVHLLGCGSCSEVVWVGYELA